jgi:hypothetical protein
MISSAPGNPVVESAETSGRSVEKNIQWPSREDYGRRLTRTRVDVEDVLTVANRNALARLHPLEPLGPNYWSVPGARRTL